MSNTKQINPLERLTAEFLAILIGIVLYINSQYSFTTFSLEELGIIGIVGLGCLYWGASGIEESEYSHFGIITNLVVKPVSRAVVQTGRNAAERIPSADFLLNVFSESRDLQEARGIVSDFDTIAFSELGMDGDNRLRGDIAEDLANKIATETNLTKTRGYRLLANEVFSSKSDNERQICLILIYCREYVKAEDSLETGETIHDIQSGISYSLSISTIDLKKWNDPAQQLLRSYGAAKDAIHQGEVLSSDPLVLKPENPPRDYYSEFAEFFLPFRDRTSLSEELVATIIDVVDRGELNQSAVARDINQIIEREKQRVQSELDSQEAYLLLSIRAGLARTSLREKIYEKYPDHIRFGRTQNRNAQSDLPKDITVTTDAIFTDRDYSGPNELLEDIKSMIPEEELEGGLLSVYRLELKNPEHHPEMEVAKNHLPARAKDSLSAIEFLETGDSTRIVTERAIDNLLGRQIEVKELLAAIPVNVFADANPKQRVIIDEAVEKLKAELRIDNLYDWGNYDSEDIVPTLVEYDSEQISTESEWEEIAEDMVEGAKQCEWAATS